MSFYTENNQKKKKMEGTYSTLTEVILAVFKHENTSILSLDKICQDVASPNLKLDNGKGIPVPCTTISRRRISSILSSSEFFIRAGAPRSCQWALRPQNPLFLSNGALASSIEQTLTEHGPLPTHEFVNLSGLAGSNESVFAHFFSSHPDEYTMDEEGRWWFANQPKPIIQQFENVVLALLFAFQKLNKECSIEELHWYLCLATTDGNKRISRRKISRELSRRTDLFKHVSRAKYSLLQATRQPPTPQIDFTSDLNSMVLPTKCPDEFSFNFLMDLPQCETPPTAYNDAFDPSEFFGLGFTCSFD